MEDYPSGYALNLTDGIVRLRFAADFERETYRSPDEIVQVEVVVPPVANRFMPGHRIRRDISSSNFPKYDINANTGEPEGEARRKRVSVNTDYLDACRPSMIVLPLIDDPEKGDTLWSKA